MKQTRSKAYAFLCIFLLGYTNAQAGDLEDFEIDATTLPSDKNTNNHMRHHGQNEKRDDNQDFFSILFGDLVETIISEVVDTGSQIVGQVIADGGANSNERVDSSDTGLLQKRNLGEPLTPYFRLNLNLQNISKNIYGFDGKLEFGIGAWAGEYRETRYRDQEQDETLKLNRSKPSIACLLATNLASI